MPEFNITYSVGNKGKNDVLDQYNIIDALNLVPEDLGGPTAKLLIQVKKHIADQKLIDAILRFQAKNIDEKYRDGRIDPKKRTINKINEIIKLPRESKPSPLPSIKPIDPLRVNIDTNIKVFQQPMTNACWATLTTMIIKSRNQINFGIAKSPEDEIRIALSSLDNGERWVAFFDKNKGLPNYLLSTFFEDRVKLKTFIPDGGFHENRIFRGSKAWMLLLRTVNRPVFVSTYRFDAAEGEGNHIITVVGVDSSIGTPNKFPNKRSPDGTVYYLDTNGGSKKTISVADLDFVAGDDDGPAGDDDTRMQRNRARIWY